MTGKIAAKSPPLQWVFHKAPDLWAKNRDAPGVQGRLF